MKSYFTVGREVETETVINRSRFICNLKGTETEAEAEAFIKEISNKYRDATHNCYAYILNEEGSIQRMSDAGEPQGTAGQPMLEVLKKNRLTKAAAVVTRYFGGIKLGAGGLIGAYTRAVAAAVERAGILTAKFSVIYSVKLPYSASDRFIQALNSMEASVLKTDYGEDVALTVAVTEEDSEGFFSAYKEATFGGDGIEIINKEYKLYK